MTRDPVCGMQIDERQAMHQSQFDGKNFSFCSETCKQTFDANPHRYSTKQPLQPGPLREGGGERR